MEKGCEGDRMCCARCCALCSSTHSRLSPVRSVAMCLRVASWPRFVPVRTGAGDGGTESCASSKTETGGTSHTVRIRQRSNVRPVGKDRDTDSDSPNGACIACLWSLLCAYLLELCMQDELVDEIQQQAFIARLGLLQTLLGFLLQGRGAERDTETMRG